MILESTMITWKIQNVQNFCSKKLQPMQLSEFDFIVKGPVKEEPQPKPSLKRLMPKNGNNHNIYHYNNHNSNHYNSYHCNSYHCNNYHWSNHAKNAQLVVWCQNGEKSPPRWPRRQRCKSIYWSAINWSIYCYCQYQYQYCNIRAIYSSNMKKALFSNNSRFFGNILLKMSNKLL